MTRPLPLPPVDERAKEERTNALRAERRAHLLAEDGHTVDGWRDDCPACPITFAGGSDAREARRRHRDDWMAR